MNYITKETLMIAILVLILIIIGMYVYANFLNIDNDNLKNMKDISKNSWTRTQCIYDVGQTYLDIFKNNSIEQDNKNWNICLPCTYDNTQLEIDNMTEKKDAKYFIISNCDNMTAKNWLWKNVYEYYGREKAETMMPKTYLLFEQEDLKRFENDYRKDKLYIMKKNIQRQEGIKITNNLEEIKKGIESEFVIVQDLIQNPYIINGRKTNMRFYVLIVCKSGDISVYVHKDGFMYYTKDMFIKNSPNEGPNITTGYIDREIYKENPLTHYDLREYLDKNDRILSSMERHLKLRGGKLSSIYFSRIYKLLSDIFTAFIGKICNGEKLYNNVTFQLFGIDIAMNDNYNPMIMEVNKGPDMEAKDERDSNLKHKVVQDIMQIINVAEGDNDFIQVLDYKDGEIVTAL